MKCPLDYKAHAAKACIMHGITQWRCPSVRLFVCLSRETLRPRCGSVAAAATTGIP